MKGYKVPELFLKCLIIFQLFVSITLVMGNDYSYSVEESYSDLGTDGLGEGIGIDSLEPFEFGSEHKKTFTSARIIDIGAIWDLPRHPGGNPNGSRKGNTVSVLFYKEEGFTSKLSRNGDYLLGSVLIAIGLFSVVGNGCILFVFLFRRRRLTPAEILLVNLGIVDILLSLASYPLTMISSFKHRWNFGELGCTLYGFVCYFLGLASIFSITAIALIRYWKTCTPARGNKITCWTSYKTIGWGYIFGLVWAVPPLIGFGNYGFEPYGLSCTLDWVARDNASRVYIMLVTIFCVFIPLFLILFCYCRIILLVRQSDALVRSNGVQKKNGKVSDIQLTWISALVTLGFIIGWTPYSVVSLWSSFRGEMILPMWATPIPVIMAKSSIAYNPFIYIFFTARYREDFRSLCRYWIRSYSKVSTGKSSRNNGNGNSSQNTNGNSNNTSIKGQRGNSWSSSLLTRLTSTNSNNNNNTPNHNNYLKTQTQNEVLEKTQAHNNVEEAVPRITENVLNAIHQNVSSSSQDLSVVIVGEIHATSHVITIINGASSAGKLRQGFGSSSFPSFQKQCKAEQV
ncbi:unnamed protein product [Orchesella dallaii]|uniref:G-protein coupled receptors family 1 profile domain-containing protein n=1 Tax=Orchesella dallaii TaxID=48710 RepID=A0ABP1PWA6_9HEXA